MTNHHTLAILVLILFYSQAAKIQKVQLSKIEHNAFTGQVKSLQIPFKRCFEVEPQLPSNQKYIDFKPSSLQLQLSKSSILQTHAKMNLLEQLRSPTSQKYQNMIVFKQYILLFLPVKQIIIVKETPNGFTTINSYQIKELDFFVHFKIYKYKQEAIIILLNRREAIILNDQEYRVYQLPQVTTVSHLEQLPGNEEQFMTVEYELGFCHYQIDRSAKVIKLLKRYSVEYFQVPEIYLVDFNLNNYKNGKIQILDKNLGVFQIKFQPTKNLTNYKPQLIVPQQNCQALDTIQSQHFVLVCRMDRSSFIVEAFKSQDNDSYKKIQPSFHRSYFNDIRVSGDYFIVFSHKAVNVFWNSKKSTLTQSINTHSQLNLPGLQAFYLRENVLFAVQSGAINKYLINQSLPELTLKFTQPIQKNMKLFYYGLCSELPNSKKQNVKTCRAQQIVKVRISRQITPTKQDFSITLSIIVVLIVVFLFLIWICLKKYRGIERETKKILDAYKNKKSSHRFVF